MVFAQRAWLQAGLACFEYLEIETKISAWGCGLCVVVFQLTHDSM
jgi:hypothetical protein